MSIYIDGYGEVSDTVDLVKILSAIFSEEDAKNDDEE